MTLVEVVKMIIKNHSDMELINHLYHEHPPLVAGFDTETTGLSILEDKPFLFQFGWYNKDIDTIYVGVIDLDNTPQATNYIKHWHTLAEQAPLYLAHNIKYDLHMIANIGCPYTANNISDTMFYIRFAHDNVTEKKGGVPLKLKQYCTKYVDATAKHHNELIQRERTMIASAWNRKLKDTLGWTMKKVDEFFKDKTNIAEDFPNIQSYLKYTEWKNSLPKDIKHVHGKLSSKEIPYTLVNRDLLIDYAAMDIVWVIRVFLLTEPVIKARGTEEGLRRENEYIYPLWSMERQGYTLDRDYVTESFIKMRKYIRQRRQDLVQAAGMELTANQNAVLLKLLNDADIPVTSTGAEVLNRLHKDYPNNSMQEVVDIVLELRTLEKWFSTYLMRFLNKDKIYTQINQVGAVSLRMSSDFQQFPKDAIKTISGEELFNPRRAIRVPDNVDAITYLDYSQIELRVQALYTILVGHPDLHLCRAYMPYKCYDSRGAQFNYEDPDCIARAYTEPWYLEEDGSEWVATDVHGATTKAAFGIDESDPEYHSLRYIGKRVNFAKNYGAQRRKISEMFPEYDDATIDAIDGGYYKAFPGIKYYQEYCYSLVRFQPYATNLFGIRYWNVSGHNLINMLIQGSSATLLKEKIVEMYNFLKPYKTKMLMPIHDEVQFLTYDDELHLLPELQKIMQSWDVYVPIVADAEITRTYWSEKEKIECK